MALSCALKPGSDGRFYVALTQRKEMAGAGTVVPRGGPGSGRRAEHGEARNGAEARSHVHGASCEDSGLFPRPGNGWAERCPNAADGSERPTGPRGRGRRPQQTPRLPQESLWLGLLPEHRVTTPYVVSCTRLPVTEELQGGSEPPQRSSATPRGTPAGPCSLARGPQSWL